jgi:hypothetical protein
VGENYAAADASEHTTSEGRTMAVPLLETSHPSFVFAVLLPLLAAAGAWLGSMAVARLGFSSFADAAGHDGSASFLTGLGVGLLFGDALFYVQLRFFSRHRSPLALFAGRSCMMMGWLGAAAIGVCALSVPLHFEITHERMRMLLLVVLAVVALRVVYAWTRKSLYTPHQAERHGDEFWRWGLFYYNPGDPVLLVQNRCRPGYTLNFANFLAWPIALGLVGDLVFLFVMQLRR